MATNKKTKQQSRNVLVAVVHGAFRSDVEANPLAHFIGCVLLVFRVAGVLCTYATRNTAGGLSAWLCTYNASKLAFT